MATDRKAKEAARNPIKITDVTLRDGHQSLFATRMRTADMEPIAADIDQIGFWSAEVWGGATFDVATRFLNEDPWERVRILKRLMPRTPLQMLLRGQNLVGYRHYADDVVRAFVTHSAEVGIDVFRVFDALNDERNFETAFKAIKQCGKHIQGALSYSLTEPKLGGPVYNVQYYVKKATTLQDMGANSLCIKDMAGLIAPDDAYELVAALKKALRIPIHLHTHYTSGMASMSCLKAIEAGVDMIDTAIAPFGLRSSHPAVEPIIAALRGTSRETGLDLARLAKIAQYLETIAPKYRDFLDTTKLSVIDTGVLMHQIPGGMFTNLVSQLREAEALDKIGAVYEELPRTRKELGYPPLVTPTSQIVGIQAVQNVLFGRYKMVSKEIKDYAYGLYGRPPVPMDQDIQKTVLKGYERGEKPISCRAADILQPEMDKAKEATKGVAKDIGDVLVYALYPTTGMKFLRWKHGLEAPPPETKARTLEEVKREDELCKKAKAGKLIEKPTQTVPVKSPAARKFNVFVGSEYYEVEVDPAGGAAAFGVAGPVSNPVFQAAPAAAPKAPEPRAEAAPKPAEARAAVSAEESTLNAPMPGLIIRYVVKVGDVVKAGDVVVVLEAMKMENALPASKAGQIKALPHKAGDRVPRDEVLAVIA